MALELVGGAALGSAVRILLKEVVDAKEKATNFQQALTRLESTLTSIIPRVNEISQLNHKLNVSDEGMKELITILRNGQALVNKSSKISIINLVKKVKYSKELLELDYSLLRYFQTILPLDHFRATKEMLLMMRELHRGHFGPKDEEDSSKPKEDGSSQEPNRRESHKPKEDESSQEPDEGESSKPKMDEYSEIQSCQDPEKKETVKLFGKMVQELNMGLVGAKDEGESSKPKEDESFQEPDEGESSKPKMDEYSEIQSCQDPEKKETVKLFGKMVQELNMGLVGAKDEGESSKPKEDESSQEPSEGESSKPKVAEYFEFKSCQDPKKKETVIQAKTKTKTLKMKKIVNHPVRNEISRLCKEDCIKDEGESSKPKENESSQEPSEGESSKPKVVEYFEFKSCQDPKKKETVIQAKTKAKTKTLKMKKIVNHPVRNEISRLCKEDCIKDEGESSKPKEDESSQEPSERESSKPKVAEYFEFKSCQDPKKKETVIQAKTKTKTLKMKKIVNHPVKKIVNHPVRNEISRLCKEDCIKDEGESSKPKEDKSSQEPSEVESSKPKEDEYSEIQSSHEPGEGESSKPKGDEYSKIQSSHEPDEGESSMTKGDDGFLFWSYKGCTFNFDLKNIYSGCVRYCECKTKHGKVLVKLVRPSVNETSPQTRKKSVRETILKRVESHPNIVPSIGCYLYKRDVLLFYDYFKRVSLYTRLHEYRGSFESSYEYRVKCPYFKWESRLKISLGVARGISHLHSLKLIHGNLHSSNVLLTSDLDGCIFDYALLDITSATQASDVHSFGLILLEMLSGKHPTEEDLPRWFSERSALKVFDSLLFLHDKSQNEAQNMMHIALQCVEEEPGKRPNMDHVVEMIQNIRPSH